MLATIAILIFCSVVQGIVGFAFSLFAVPLLLISGYSLPQAVALALASSLVQKATMIFRLRRSIQLQGIWVPALFMLIMLPVGVYVLHLLGNSDTGLVKKILGGLILFILAFRFLIKVEPHEKLHWSWGMLAGGLSGFFQGLANVGGPPIVLWSMAHRWPPERLRSITPTLVILLAPFQVIMLQLTFSADIWPSAGRLGVIVPVVVLASIAGIWLGGHLHVDHLRKVVTVLLILLAIMLIYNPFAHLKTASNIASKHSVDKSSYCREIELLEKSRNGTTASLPVRNRPKFGG